MNLLRSLFPHWNFFDRLVTTYELEVKLQGQELWQRVCFDQKRHAFSLNVNADLNLALANVSLLVHFVRDLEEAKDVKNLTTFKMISSLVKVVSGPTVNNFRVMNGTEVLYQSEELA
jgi:hypothetical protein